MLAAQGWDEGTAAVFRFTPQLLRIVQRIYLRSFVVVGYLKKRDMAIAGLCRQRRALPSGCCAVLLSGCCCRIPLRAIFVSVSWRLYLWPIGDRQSVTVALYFAEISQFIFIDGICLTPLRMAHSAQPIWQCLMVFLLRRFYSGVRA